jgi:hypothetical protein
MKHTIIIVILTLTSAVYSGIESQTDWSGGPGESAPVLQWLSNFNTGSGIDYSQSGSIELGTAVVYFDCFTVSDSFGSYGGIAPGDFDGDGDIDLICDDMDQWKFALFENLDGLGTQWEMHELFEMPWIPDKCSEAVDLDQDGDLDLLTATDMYFTYWENTDGSGLNWDCHTLADSSGGARRILGADIDGDGDNDVVGCDGDGIKYWENIDGAGLLWTEHIISLDPELAEEIEVADIDGDGDLDVFCADDGSSGNLCWFENLGEGAWQSNCITPVISNICGASSGDYDGDGDIDFSVSTIYNTRMYVNLDGVGGNWSSFSLPQTFGFRPLYLRSSDIDFDGDLDISGSGLKNDVDDVLVIFENLDGSGVEWELHMLRTEHPIARFRSMADVNNDGYVDFLAAVGGPGILWYDVIGPADTGWVQSSILDVVGYPQWDNISWVSTEPAGTDVYFQVRSSNDSEDMGDWSANIFDPGNLSGYIDSTHRYVQYLACLTSESETASPVLNDVSLEWSNMGIEVGESPSELLITTIPNPAVGSVSIMIPSLSEAEAAVSIYDISGKIVRVLTGRNRDTFLWDCCDSGGNEVPAGTYLVRCETGERTASQRLVKL